MTNGSIYRPCVDNGSKNVEMICIPIEVNGVQPYVPFHSEHVTYAILIS